jgi:hypothetical protein
MFGLGPKKLLVPKINGSIFLVRHTISLIFTIMSFQVHEHVIYNGPTNALVCNKTLIQMSHTITFKLMFYYKQVH